MNKHIIFSDVDGTLLNDDHRLSEVTHDGIHRLLDRGIPFVIVSARSPAGIFPILDDLGIRQPIIAHGGALILDADRKPVYEESFPVELAAEVADFIDNSSYAACWNAFDQNTWLVRDKNDPLLIEEERIVRAQATAADLHLRKGTITKILCICRVDQSAGLEKKLAARFPQLSIVRSGALNIEIMPKGATKGTGVAKYCELHGYDPADAYAFGDQHNDLPMLRAVGHGYLMGSAPADLQDIDLPRAPHNNDDGLIRVLSRDGLL